MKLTGKKIISGRYGEGAVTAQEERRITVSFDSVGEKRFAFPQAFLLDLRMKDRRSQKLMEEFLAASQAQAEAERTKAREAAAARLYEAFEQVRAKKQRSPRATPKAAKDASGAKKEPAGKPEKKAG